MRLIDADALKEDLRESYEALQKIYVGLKHHEDKRICGGQLSSFLEAILRVKDAPTIEAAPVRHGKWENAKYIEAPVYVCSECGNREPLPRKFCPECGAMMDALTFEEAGRKLAGRV